MSNVTTHNQVITINRAAVKSNVQRVAYRLLTANGQWVSSRQLARIPSATARVRDLRKQSYGAFQVECASAADLKRNVKGKVFYYRIVPSSVTPQNVSRVFE